MRVLSLLSVVGVLACLVSTCAGQAAQVIANASDATGVNYALTIERLDSTFWSCYLSTFNVANQPYCAYMPANYTQFSQQDFANAGYNVTVWNAVNLIAQEELTHAALLNITVQALGYAPVQPCQYTYPNVTSVANYLNLGLTFETTGTAAYAGSLNGLTSPALVQAAASIASVEARHAAYLAALLGTVPFNPSGFNVAYNSTYVASLIAPFYVNPSCLAQTALPMVRPFGITNYPNINSAPFTGNQSAAYGVTYTKAQQANDLLTLNYALVLEELEATFYNNASTAFTAAQFAAAGYSNNVQQYLGIIAGNENTHVAVLSAIITAYGGTPVQNCTYNFSALGVNAFSSIQNYLTYASALENVGVMAYDGAANTLTDTYLLQAAATIDMIEDRHAAFIATLLYPTNGSAPFPTALDTPMTPAQVYAMVTGLGIITSCGNQSISFPTAVNPVPSAVAPPAGNATASSSSSSSTGSSNSSASAPVLPTGPYVSSTGSNNQYNGASTSASAQWMIATIVAASAIVAMLL